MPENLLVGIVGRSGSGRTHTWNTIFKRLVRTGRLVRRLYLNKSEYVEVFLINGSPGERKMSVNNLITVKKPRITLCSIQYTKSAIKTIDWFIKNKYFLFIHWLNPGYNSSQLYFDNLNLVNKLLAQDSLVGIRNGKLDPGSRIEEILDFIYSWAQKRKLIQTDLRKV